MTATNTLRFLAFLFTGATFVTAADLPGSKDPPGMKRYEGSEIIGYRAPMFDEVLLPLGPPTTLAPPGFEKSQRVEGQVSRHTYLAPAGRTPAEVFRNYQSEFQRLGLQILYQKNQGQRGWFGTSFQAMADADQIGQILGYAESEERLLVGKTRDAQPAYYMVFVTSYHDGVIPHHLEGRVTKDRALAFVIAVAPDIMEKRMVFVSAAEMRTAIRETGKAALYGIYFDTDKDQVKPESQAAMEEIAKLLKSDGGLRLHVVGHTDNQGRSDYNLDLSRRRAASVVRELTQRFGIAPDRLDSFGAGLYSPVASNGTDEGRAKNRRVELVEW
jgi:outer membrane protein OmpA-like peptidoglycan-associated protein